jgi:archaetidylinositol phosphate synthase
LDHTFDRLSDLAILAGIGFSSYVSEILALSAFIAVILASYLGTQAHALTGKRLYDGILGRGDRLALIFAGSLFSHFYNPASLNFVVWAILILSAVTFAQRFAALWKMLR